MLNKIKSVYKMFRKWLCRCDVHSLTTISVIKTSMCNKPAELHVMACKDCHLKITRYYL